jgi:cyclic pyranopterin monophosphate synthase
LPLSFVGVDGEVDADAGEIVLTAEARTTGQTGVEMEALTAASVAALTVYDMVKGLERGVSIEQVALVEKRGGRSDYHAEREDPELSARTEGEDPQVSERTTGEAPHLSERTTGDRLDGEREGRRKRRPSDLRAALITISTSKADGHGEDEGSVRLAEFAERLGAQIVGRELITDDREAIESCLRHWCEAERATLVLTTGGTGVSPTDVTPEATAAVIEREVPGIAEAMRAASLPYTANWMLSRAMAGVRGDTLIVNFPGSPASIDQAGEALLPALEHAVELIQGHHPAH